MFPECPHCPEGRPKLGDGFFRTTNIEYEGRMWIGLMKYSILNQSKVLLDEFSEIGVSPLRTTNFEWNEPCSRLMYKLYRSSCASGLNFDFQLIVFLGFRSLSAAFYPDGVSLYCIKSLGLILIPTVIRLMTWNKSRLYAFHWFDATVLIKETDVCQVKYNVSDQQRTRQQTLG